MQADIGADNPALISPLRTRVSGVAQEDSNADPAMIRIDILQIFRISIAPARHHFGFGDSAP